jgi:hypothetical protein
MSRILNLDGIKSGSYKVSTITGDYFLFDFNNNKALCVYNGESVEINNNSRWFKFLTISCKYNERMTIWYIESDSHFTRLYSTEVQKIEKVNLDSYAI